MADDTLGAELAKAKKTASDLQSACRIPDRKPDFTACGGPAAEAYWDYFTPARVISLLAAAAEVLRLADRMEHAGPPVTDLVDRVHTARHFREAVERAMAGVSFSPSLPARADFRTALAALARDYALDVQAGVPAAEVARVMDEARMRLDERQREKRDDGERSGDGTPAGPAPECPESKMGDGRHAADYEDSGSCPWCGAVNPGAPGEQ